MLRVLLFSLLSEPHSVNTHWDRKGDSVLVPRPNIDSGFGRPVHRRITYAHDFRPKPLSNLEVKMAANKKRTWTAIALILLSILLSIASSHILLWVLESKAGAGTRAVVFALVPSVIYCLYSIGKLNVRTTYAINALTSLGMLRVESQDGMSPRIVAAEGETLGACLTLN